MIGSALIALGGCKSPPRTLGGLCVRISGSTARFSPPSCGGGRPMTAASSKRFRWLPPPR
eukprot:2852223-Alexandrium_andersonii.AAC.1